MKIGTDDCAGCDRLAEKITELVKQKKELREALEMVEWEWFGGWRCLWCRGMKAEEGHAPDCPRQKALGL